MSRMEKVCSTSSLSMSFSSRVSSFYSSMSWTRWRNTHAFTIVRIKSTENLSNIWACIRHLGLSFFTLSKSLHLIFDLFENRCWSCRHAIEILYILAKFIRQIFFDGFNKEIQVLHIVLYLCRWSSTLRSSSRINLILDNLILNLNSLLLLQVFLLINSGWSSFLATGWSSSGRCTKVFLS